MNLENKEVLIYIDCGNNYLIDIEDISIQQKRQSCSRTQKQCFISNEDKTLINNACHNRRNCTKQFKLNSKCLYITEYAYYNMSYKCSKEERKFILFKTLFVFVKINEPTTNGRKITCISWMFKKVKNNCTRFYPFFLSFFKR